MLNRKSASSILTAMPRNPIALPEPLPRAADGEGDSLCDVRASSRLKQRPRLVPCKTTLGLVPPRRSTLPDLRLLLQSCFPRNHLSGNLPARSSLSITCSFHPHRPRSPELYPSHWFPLPKTTRFATNPDSIPLTPTSHSIVTSFGC